jgi:hypothetical protein
MPLPSPQFSHFPGVCDQPAHRRVVIAHSGAIDGKNMILLPV